MLLILPLPFTWRKKVFTFISENAFVAKLQYGMKVCYFSLVFPMHKVRGIASG